jgi:hypothetical protein
MSSPLVYRGNIAALMEKTQVTPRLSHSKKFFETFFSKAAR